MGDRWRWTPLGEAALLIESLLDDLALANREALALARCIGDADLAGLQSVTPAMNSVLVRFDPLRLEWPGAEQHLRECATSVPCVEDEDAPRRVMTIPVRYGGEYGPDLDDVSKALGLSPADVIAAHTARVYRVMMIGFAPGFPYIGPLPESLYLPRRATPRAAVPMGSVAIAAGMTGIYPSHLPGGWHVIGRTDVSLFDAQSDPPSLLQAGDGVQFVSVA